MALIGGQKDDKTIVFQVSSQVLNILGVPDYLTNCLLTIEPRQYNPSWLGYIRILINLLG